MWEPHVSYLRQLRARDCECVLVKKRFQNQAQSTLMNPTKIKEPGLFGGIPGLQREPEKTHVNCRR
jgi:hypothetical protein